MRTEQAHRELTCVRPHDIYVIEALLGFGGYGTVYRAHDRVWDRTVALKVLDRPDGDALWRFRRSFRRICHLHHENLAQLYRLDCHEGQWRYSMELVRGCPLTIGLRPELATGAIPSGTTGSVGDPVLPVTQSQARGDIGPPIPSQVKALRAALAQLVQAAMALHRADIIHRDIKPSNVLLRRDGRVKLLDYGLADVLGQDGDAPENTVWRGTPRYAAPEIGRGGRLTDAADWYSVGVVLLELLTGQPSPAALERLQPGVPDDLAALCRALLDPCPERRPGGRELLSALTGRRAPVERRATSREPPLIGRGSELAAIEAAQASAAAGEPVLVAVHGAAGVGKSSLLEAVSGAASVRVLRGRCYDTRTMAFNGFDALVDDLRAALLVHSQDQVASWAIPHLAALVRLFPVLAYVPGLRAEAVSPLSGPVSARHQAVMALKAILGRLRERGPLAVVIDDLQWADGDSRALLADLVGPPAVGGVLFAVATRDNALPAALQRAAPRATVRVDLRGLPEAESVHVAMAYGAGEAQSRRIATLAGGSPLLLRLLAQGGGRAGNDVEQALAHGVDSLGSQARAALEVLSVSRRPLWSALVAESAGLDLDAWMGASRELSARGLVRWSHTLVDRVEVRHDRIRAAVCARLPDRRRRELVHRLAAALEAVGGADAASAHALFREAGDDAAAQRFLDVAADDAERGFAFEVAADLLAELIEAAPPGPLRTELLVRRGHALVCAGRAESAAGALLEAAGDAGEPFDLRLGAATALAVAGRFDRSLGLFEAILGELGLARAPAGAAVLLPVVRDRLLARWARPARPRFAQEAVPAALRRELDVLHHLASSLFADDIRRSLYYHERVLRLAFRHGTALDVARAVLRDARFGGLAGDAHEVVEDLERLAGPDAPPDLLRHLESLRAVRDLNVGRWASAHEHLEAAMAMTEVGDPTVQFERIHGHWDQAECLFRLGRLRDLRQVLDEVLAEAERFGNRTMTAMFLHMDTYTRLALGSADEVDRRIREVEGQVRHHSSGWAERMPRAFARIAWTLARLYSGQGGEAWDTISCVWPTLRSLGMLLLPYGRVTVNHVRARCAVAAASQGVRPRALIRVAGAIGAQMARERLPWAGAMGDSIQAAVAVLEGRPRDGVWLHERAAARFEALEMRLYAAAERWLAGGASGDAAGERRRADAEAVLRAAGVVEPAAWVRGFTVWR